MIIRSRESTVARSVANASRRPGFLSYFYSDPTAVRAGQQEKGLIVFFHRRPGPPARARFLTNNGGGALGAGGAEDCVATEGC